MEKVIGDIGQIVADLKKLEKEIGIISFEFVSDTAAGSFLHIPKVKVLIGTEAFEKMFTQYEVRTELTPYSNRQMRISKQVGEVEFCSYKEVKND